MFLHREPFIVLFLSATQHSSAFRHLEKDVDTPITRPRRRSWKSFRRTLPANLTIAPEDSLDSAQRPPKRPRLAPPSRNRQASQANSLVITRVMNDNHLEQIKFICPECGWKQANKRVPDFKRHLKTHLRAKDDDHSSGYWCKGVRVEDASEYAIHPDATPYTFLDHERIGGCMRTFSRRDALKRHLDNTNISCVRETLN